MEIKWLQEAENEPMGQQCALEGRACSRKENSENFRVTSVLEITGKQGHVCWPLLLQRVKEGQVGDKGGGGKDLDAILGCVCKIISSSNWRMKSLGQNKIIKDQEEEHQKGSACRILHLVFFFNS